MSVFDDNETRRDDLEEARQEVAEAAVATVTERSSEITFDGPAEFSFDDLRTKIDDGLTLTADELAFAEEAGLIVAEEPPPPVPPLGAEAVEPSEALVVVAPAAAVPPKQRARGVDPVEVHLREEPRPVGTNELLERLTKLEQHFTNLVSELERVIAYDFGPTLGRPRPTEE